MSSYTGTADRPDKAKAIAAVVAVHVGLAVLILSGLNVRMVGQVVEQLKTFDVREPPPPPAKPPPPAPRPQQARREAGEPAKKAEAAPIVAPTPKLPLPSPVPAAKVAGIGSGAKFGRGNFRQRHGRRRLGHRPGRRRLWRLFALHPGAAHHQDSRPRISPARRNRDSKRKRRSDHPRQSRRERVELPGRAVERRRFDRCFDVPADRELRAVQPGARPLRPAGRPGRDLFPQLVEAVSYWPALATVPALP